ncbi:hypothetical protein BGZ89_006253 [Linnemannia elongata]|nr:hypothetical protein BGZ89_006253 [Linnemannia elongata]
MSRYDPIPTYNDDDFPNGTISTANGSKPQQSSSPSPGSYHNNNHQRFNDLPLSTSSSSVPVPPWSSSPSNSNRLNNNYTNTSSSFFPDFTSTIRTRASSIISISSTSLRSSTSVNASIGIDGGDTSQRSSYSDHGSESSAPFMPLLPHNNNNNNNSAPSLEEGGLFPPHPFSPPGITVTLASALSSIQSRNNSDKTAFNKDSNNSGKKKASIRTPRHIIRLRWIWVLALLAGEHGSFWIMVHRCSWPESSSWDKSEEALSNRYRMAIIADPQLTDWMSYHQSGLLLALVEAYTDIYMKRSFRRLHASLRPDAVLFLGDLNDGGRNTDSQTFIKNTRRFFEWVFATKRSAWNQEPIVTDALVGETAVSALAKELQNNDSEEENSSYLKKRQELTPEEKAVKVDITGHYVQRVEVPLEAEERRKIRESGKSLRLYVAGNHDVGFGDTLIQSSMVRYKRVFGSVNYEVNVGNHSLVVLDTLALSSKDHSIRGESQQFLDDIKQEQLSLPRILFTHVPLHRLETTSCGKARETKQLIMDSGGEQYQNMVDSSLSREILESVQPDMVFSGDDHDWCEIAHPTVGGNLTPEVTLRTFSFAQGIQRPSFGMMTLFNPDLKPKNVFPVVPLDAGLPVSNEFATESVERPSGDTTFVYDECMLPWQMMIYMLYGALFGVSLSWIIIRQVRWMVVSRQRVKSLSILGRWRNDNRDDTENTLDINPKLEDDSIGSSSSRADQQLDGTTLTDDQHHQQKNELDLYYDDEPPVGPLSLATSSSAAKEKRMMRQWPLCAGLFWRQVFRDLWGVVKYVVPFYVFLFVCSII